MLLGNPVMRYRWLQFAFFQDMKIYLFIETRNSYCLVKCLQVVSKSRCRYSYQEQRRQHACYGSESISCIVVM